MSDEARHLEFMLFNNGFGTVRRKLIENGGCTKLLASLGRTYRLRLSMVAPELPELAELDLGK